MQIQAKGELGYVRFRQKWLLKRIYNDWLAKQRLSMRQVRKAGEKLFVHDVVHHHDTMLHCARTRGINAR